MVTFIVLMFVCWFFGYLSSDTIAHKKASPADALTCKLINKALGVKDSQ